MFYFYTCIFPISILVLSCLLILRKKKVSYFLFLTAILKSLIFVYLYAAWLYYAEMNEVIVSNWQSFTLNFFLVLITAVVLILIIIEAITDYFSN